MFNAQIAQWTQELSVTTQPQGKNHLTVVGPQGQAEGLCCLGVWCEMIQRGEVEDAKPMDVTETNEDGLPARSNSVFKVIVNYDGESGELPKAAYRAMNINSANPMVVIENIHYIAGSTQDYNELEKRFDNPRSLLHAHVSELNDDYGLTFAQIADVVNYAGLDCGEWEDRDGEFD